MFAIVYKTHTNAQLKWVPKTIAATPPRSKQPKGHHHTIAIGGGAINRRAIHLGLCLENRSHQIYQIYMKNKYNKKNTQRNLTIVRRSALNGV